MPDYRRWFVQGGTYFFTIVTCQRMHLFNSEGTVELLRDAIRSVQAEMPFTFHAGVVLPDHMHFLWSLPHGDANYSKRIGIMKASFSRAAVAGGLRDRQVSASRRKHGDRGFWQRRFWEHTIEDVDDFERHFDYIHYNPVKHGHATCPHV